MRLIPLLLFAIACGSEPTDTGSACPSADDACMDEDNYQECLETEASCEDGIAILESCPLQFACQ